MKWTGKGEEPAAVVEGLVVSLGRRCVLAVIGLTYLFHHFPFPFLDPLDRETLPSSV
jgi:hypothetical protein